MSVITDHENPSPIDLLTVYDADDAILAEGQTQLKLQLTMGFWPTRNRYNAATKRRISNICHYFQ